MSLGERFDLILSGLESPRLSKDYCWKDFTLLIAIHTVRISLRSGRLWDRRPPRSPGPGRSETVWLRAQAEARKERRLQYWGAAGGGWLGRALPRQRARAELRSHAHEHSKSHRNSAGFCSHSLFLNPFSPMLWKCAFPRWRYFLLVLSDTRPCPYFFLLFMDYEWWSKEETQLIHYHQAPPAPTTIIYLVGPNPPSQIFTGCWFHSVTVTIWTLHGGLISCTRPIRKLTGSCRGQSWKSAPGLGLRWRALLAQNDVFT